MGSTGHGYTAVLIVPTGVGASIGGYAGDALPVAKTMASVVDTLITHPNVMNGASLYWPLSNMLYTEGYLLDNFARGKIGLLPVTTGGHRIGLLLDKEMTKEMIERHLQAADAARATLGINVCNYLVTDEEVGVTVAMTSTGASRGDLNNLGTLIRGAERLVKECKCTAIAVVCKFPEDESDQGDGVDPVGGMEAIISHAITSKVAAEEIGFTFLPCVLAYLHRAPVVVPPEDPRANRAIWARDVDAVIIPANAAGGLGTISLGLQTNALVIAVEDNKTKMQAEPEDLALDCVRVSSYLEAIGMLAAHRAGRDLRG
ncbi:hypothetical protein GUITHDRAFT_158393 [Guillardia theta CCMP2712]|uniref:DUF3326 domain-containing protein n=1 Tax=Guillardia theta (strain CCMP2712) TaxID=905079 RepID=L1ITG2_GUITC|nr:hypothetical protein GUITHDRAFT_158393 [Guillardia theta CCMP2712]EKX39556.1 hypothetical protein GUITHDRAFT_158393 [Guillardia theta CCMP2712]|eukprot:XP_005826536.1 hypothetical protein GUITHDRAFT_158393 [Guillardia theta CCMP2712]